MTLRTFCLSASTAWVLPSFALLAATFTVQTLSVPTLMAGKAATVSRVVRLTGPIEEGDAARLRDTLADLRRGANRPAGEPLAIVEMSSPGGDLMEGLKLGYLFREFDVATLVRGGDTCLSACALAFLGGTSSHLPTNIAVSRTLEVGATLGFHNFYLNPNSDAASSAANPRDGIAKGFNQAKGGASMLVHYAASLGVDVNFIARLLGRPSESWEYTNTAGEFMDLKICPTGVTLPPPAPQQSAINICSNALGAPPSDTAQRTRRMLQIEAKRLLLEHVQKNIAATSLSGPLSAQLAAVLSSRNDRLVDSVYADLKAAGLPLPEITGPTFAVNGFDAGVYGLQCIASVSLDDPDRFDVIFVGPTGLTKAPNRPPPSCGRLFSFDRDADLNPDRK